MSLSADLACSTVAISTNPYCFPCCIRALITSPQCAKSCLSCAAVTFMVRLPTCNCAVVTSIGSDSLAGAAPGASPPSPGTAPGTTPGMGFTDVIWPGIPLKKTGYGEPAMGDPSSSADTL